MLQSSFNIAQAKKNGVFVSEYKPSKDILNLGDITLKIEAIWVEYFWEYKNQQKEINKMSDVRGLIKLDTKEDLSRIDVSYSNNSKKSVCITGNKLCFKANKDTIRATFYGENEVIVDFIRQ